MTWWQSLVLGLVQGLTEFLPVSSSGHLVLAGRLLGVEDAGVAYDVALHVATLAAVLYVYGRDVAAILGAFAAGLAQWGRGRPATAWRTPEGRLFWMLAAASLPTGVIGLVGEAMFEGLYGSLAAVSVFWLVTGALLFWAADRLEGKRGLQDMRWGDALLIGTFQGFAIAPGLSRSGSTVAAALGRGFDAREAARFSFLLALPATAGAAALKLPDLAASPATPLPVVAVGVAAAAVAGVWAIRTFVAALASGRLRGFAVYVWLLGLAVLGVTFLG